MVLGGSFSLPGSFGPFFWSGGSFSLPDPLSGAGGSFSLPNLFPCAGGSFSLPDLFSFFLGSSFFFLNSFARHTAAAVMPRHLANTDASQSCNHLGNMR